MFAAGCSVDGAPRAEADLSARVVEPSAFPYGPATPVPAVALPGAVADITFRPLRSVNDPAECTPAQVDAAGVHASTGPGGPAGGVLTVMVATVSDSRDDFVASLCPTFRLGGTVGTTVRTRTVDPAGDPIVNERDLEAGGIAYTHVYEIVRQQGRVRLYVQNRYSSASLSDEEKAATRTLFDAASTAAFGG